MKGKKRAAPARRSPADAPPDDTLARIAETSDDASPKVYKIVERGTGESLGRRGFVKKLTGTLGLTALGSLLAGCSKSDYAIAPTTDDCACHVVCGCDVVKEDEDYSSKGSTYESEYTELVCTCDKVCVCNSVCTCNTVCSCDGDSGSTYYTYYYYYTYWYPN